MTTSTNKNNTQVVFHASRRGTGFWITLAATAVLAIPGEAITINLSLAPTSASPGFDASNNQLMNSAQAAANFWEDVIEDNVVVDITMGYQDLASATWGLAVVDGFDGLGRPTSGAIAIDTLTAGGIERDYFFDPTPTFHAGYGMQQVLVRDLTPAAQNLYYDSPLPPGLMEVGYWGPWNGGIHPGKDMYSLVLHEMGHILGLSQGLPDFAGESADGDFDIHPNFVSGQTVAAKYFGPGLNDRDHVRASDGAMSVGGGNGDRNLPGATDILSMASVAGWNSIDLPRVDFFGLQNPATSHQWNAATNWEGGKVPDIDGEVYVRHGGNVELFNFSVAGQLTIRDGSSVETNDDSLAVEETLAVEAGPGGADALLTIEHGGLVMADRLNVNDGGTVSVSSAQNTVNHHRVEVNQMAINEGGTLLGHGAIAAASTWVNEGTIAAVSPVADPTRALWLVNAGVGGEINLDGDTGTGQVSAVLGDLQVASPLSDPFDGQLSIGQSRTATFATDWILGDPGQTGGTLNLAGGATELTAARLIGPSWTAQHGEINVSGHALILPTTTIGDAITVLVAEDGFIDFEAQTTLHGGTFHTHSNLSSEGAVRLNGPTTWDGNVTINGIAQQIGDATITGATVIHADVLDMDGAGSTTWNVSRNAVIHTGSVDSSISNTFDGTLNVSGGILGRLTLNLTGAFDHWIMAGEMNLAGENFSAFPIDRLHGSHMRLTGELNLNHQVRIAADTTFDNSSTTTFASAATTVQMTGNTFVSAGATFVGAGTLANGVPGEMTLADGIILNELTLSNRGLLQIGTSPGTATVEAFENLADGTWLVELGGHLPGTEFDRLLAGSGALLDGLLEVELVDAGGGLFLPEVGDMFTILTSPGDLLGTFVNNPVSQAAGQQFHWNVLYEPNDVILQLVDITTVPEPTSLALVGCLALFLGFARGAKP